MISGLSVSNPHPMLFRRAANRSKPRPWSALLACLIGSVLTVPSAAQPSAPTPSQIDDPLKPHQPKHPRSESQQDRIDATALLLVGRTLENQAQQLELADDKAGARQKYAEALRAYQRAYRYGPESTTILSAIVPLAQHTGRTDQAVRYALMAVEKDASDPELLRQMAIYLTQQNHWQRALNLYQRLLENETARKNAAESLLVRLEMGRLLLFLKQYEQASDQLTTVQIALEKLAATPRDNTIRKLLLGNRRKSRQLFELFGECHLKANRLDKAQQAFEKAYPQTNGKSASQNAGRLGYHLARIAAQRNEPLVALNHLQAYFDRKLAVEGAAPYRLLDQLAAELGPDPPDIPRLEQLYAADRNNRPLAYHFAQALRQRGQWEQAQDVYQQIIQREEKPLPVDAYRGLIELDGLTGNPRRLLDNLATLAMQMGSLSFLEEQIRRVAADKNLVEQLVALGRDGADQADRNAAAGQHLAIAWVALAADQTDEAQAAFERAIPQLPQGARSWRIAWALQLYLAEQYSAAATAFLHAAETPLEREDSATLIDRASPIDRAMLLNYRAGALQLAGQTDQAVATARDAQQLRPDSAQIARQLPWVLYHADRHHEAMKGYLELIRKFDSDFSSAETRETMREARMSLSNLHVVQGDYEPAEELLEQVLDEFPDAIGALNDLAYLWVDQGKHLQRALGMIEQAVEAEPENKAYLDSLGWAHYQLGQYEKAVGQLQKAAAGDDADPVILDHLGDAYAKMGRLAQAKDVWTRALQAFEKNENAKEAKRVASKLDSKDPDPAQNPDAASVPSLPKD